ncbi:MAG: NAD(P)/FAD-dependent oxidoreductase, partial [Bacteroidetes bacterium]|nr:NAD(P)/FAD-dependent oxidoreductase [Bacteroidota bacterium]
MSDYKYIIVGAGMTADSALKGIRETDNSGSIAVFGEEKDPPYNRPPLSKGLWKGDPIESIWRGGEYKNVDFFPSTRITSLDLSHNTVRSPDGK